MNAEKKDPHQQPNQTRCKWRRRASVPDLICYCPVVCLHFFSSVTLHIEYFKSAKKKQTENHSSSQPIKPTVHHHRHHQCRASPPLLLPNARATNNIKLSLPSTINVGSVVSDCLPASRPYVLPCYNASFSYSSPGQAFSCHMIALL